MKIKVKEITKGCFPVRTGEDKSDCFDLCLAEDVTLKKGEVYVAKLGIATELPKGLVLGLAAIITYYKGGVRADGAEIVPNDAPEIMNLLKELWATGCTKKVAEGVLAADFIWGEDLNKIPGLTEAVKADLDSIQEKGMLETVKGIL